jgi:hypothetical protein
MSSKQQRFRVAVLDDYQNVALSLADWSVLDGARPSPYLTTISRTLTPSSSALSYSTSCA